MSTGLGRDLILTYLTRDGDLYDVYSDVDGEYYWRRQRNYRGESPFGALDLLSSSKLDLLRIALKRGWIKLIRGKLPMEKYARI
jgi:hypothetical protein